MSITLSTTAGSVTLKENYAAYEKGATISGGPYVHKEYLLEDWTKSDAVINALVGTVSASTLGGSITRVYPHACPESPNLVCIDAKAVGQAEIDAKDSGRPRFNQCVITAQYGIPNFGQDPSVNTASQLLNSFEQDNSAGSPTGQPYVYAVQSIDFDQEVIKLPGSAYTFTTAPNLPVDVPVAVTIGTATLVISRKLVPYLPVATILSKMNRINTATMFGQPRGTVKFSKARTKVEISSDGTRSQEIELVFKWREYDWNKFHRPDESSFDTIQDASARMPYTYADLTPLLV